MGTFVMDFEQSQGGLLAHAAVSAGERDDAYVDFSIFSGAPMGYLWQSWVEIQSSGRRRSVTLIADVEDDGMKPYRAWSFDQLPEELVEALEDPTSIAPLELFKALVQAVTPVITVWPIDDEFMLTLPDRAPPWPSPEAEAEIENLPRWQGERIG
ncbi:hypothetical protein ACOCJ4_05710 [Knoellia sp. CPCC 206435]|uniref:hypothetical protein n=1 Tax=Knoellia terrae TaxID=3404797 RepID=UPI003B43465F